MKKDRSVKQRLFSAILVLVMLFTSLLGTTFAWFTDQVSSAGNQIVSGTLKVDLSVKGENDQWVSLKQNPEQPIFDYKHWEPGYTRVEQLKVDNLGTLALKYQLSIEVALGTADIGENNAKLSDVIDVYVADGEKTAGSFAEITEANGWTRKGTLTEVMEKPSEFVQGQLNADGKENDNAIVMIALHMQESAGNEYQNLSAGDIFVNLIATQVTVESDSFGTDYDDKAEFPEIDIDDLAIEVEVENGLVKATKSASRAGISITVPAGVKVDGVTDGTATLVLSVDEKAESEANVTLDDDEILQPLDVHVEGVSAQNQKAIVITIEKAMPTGLNMGNYKLYHVENGATNVMTSVDAAGVDAHNEFYYDPATGDTTLGLVTFSEVAVVADTENAWKGNFDYTWYTNAVAPVNAEGDPDYVIANADQLAAFGAIVGGMDGQTQDSFSGKTVKLIADVNLGDDEEHNNTSIIFYPIGYWNSEETYEKNTANATEALSSGFYTFEGTFDGNGHTVSNFYQNTWEMKGDHNWYDPIKEQYYRDGMGLFGKVYGGTVKNLTVKNFSSDGEITTTGVIAAYADGATFENIAIFNCNPRVYNIGNGGIVGCVGWYAKEAGLTTTFTNITVDNSNKISALWGSYDVACGGIVGQYYPTSGQSSANYPVNAGVHFENCHVSAIMDVYNDVCANYQYYAYRYTGMLIGSVRENETIDGHVYPKMDGITASGCTVHFGTWNDYYYCEIIDNTTASYTHDYQMSRLTEIKALDGTTITYLDGTTGTVPASGRANYVIVDYSKGHGTNNATCYHFKNGAVWTHDMGGIQTGIDENGDGQDDLKEDKQHIYLEFNNLVTGYGWGVTSRGFSNLDGVKNLDIEQGDHEESVNKFNPLIQHDSKFATESTETIGDLFEAIENVGVDIKSDNVQVTISPFGATSTAGGTYVANTTDWTQGTLTFSGVGQAVITITDYYFCKTASVTVNIVATDKFDTNFVNHDKYLYRVGNANESTVALGTIFKHSGKGTINSAKVDVTFTPVAGNANGTFTANKSDWTKGTIQFTGTGVVKVTIKDDTSKEFVLNLEVVDAKNYQGKSGESLSATENNVVLLTDCGSSGFTVSNGFAFYGNGFKVTCSGKGTYLNNGGMTRGYVNVEGGGVLDNTQVICDIYPQAFVYASEVKVNSNLDTEASTADKSRYMYQLSAIAVSGNGSVISNCYAYGGRNNIYVGGGNVSIENTVTECGTLANIQVKSSSEYTVILKDIVTNQYQTQSPYDTTKTMLGFGVLVGDNESASNPTLRIQNSLTQYNWVTDADTHISNEYAKQAIDAALNVKAYQHTYNGQTTVNTGIIYLNNQTRVIDDQRADHGYVGNTVTISIKDPNTGVTGNVNAFVYSLGASSGNYETNENDYNATTQGDVRPNIEFNLGKQTVVGEDRYLKGDINGIEARYEEGQNALNLDITNLFVASKHGITLDVTAYCLDPDGVEYSNIVTLSKAGTYTLKFIVKDNVSFNSNGELLDKMVEREYTVSLALTIAEPAIADATITIDPSNWTGEYTNKSTDGSKNLSFNLLQNVKVTDAGSNFDLKGNGGTAEITYSATSGGYGNAFGGVTTIKVTYKDGQVLTMKMKKISGNAPGDPKTVTYDVSTGLVKSSKQLAKNSCTQQTWQAYEYSFKGLNGKTITSDVTVEITVAADTSSGGCVTPDTLVTLADGTQKRIDQVTYDDQLLVWDFYNGKYAVSSAAIIFNHGYAENTIIKLAFSDGTVVKVANLHQFYDNDLNSFVTIDAESVAQYVGHSFAKQSGEGYTTVTLDSYEVSVEYEAAYGIISAYHYNIIVEGMISTDFMVEDYNLFNYFEIGEDMTFDEAQMQADIEKYGLYTYDDFADYLTYEQFVAFNVQYFKIAVGKGDYTFEGILALIDEYLNA